MQKEVKKKFIPSQQLENPIPLGAVIMDIVHNNIEKVMELSGCDWETARKGISVYMNAEIATRHIKKQRELGCKKKKV